MRRRRRRPTVAGELGQNGVMGAKSWNDRGLDVVGMPSYEISARHKIVYHTLGDERVRNFVELSAARRAVTRSSSVIRVIEMERSSPRRAATTSR